MQIRALQCVVRQNPAVGDVLFGADEQRLRVDYALAGKAAAAEQIHAHLTAESTVRLKASAAGENTRKISRTGRAQAGAHAGMYDAVAGDDAPALTVEHRCVHRMQHRADELADRAGRGHGVAVERENIGNAVQSAAVAGYDVQLAFSAAQQPRKLKDRAALALKARVRSAP